MDFKRKRNKLASGQGLMWPRVLNLFDDRAMLITWSLVLDEVSSTFLSGSMVHFRTLNKSYQMTPGVYTCPAPF